MDDTSFLELAVALAVDNVATGGGPFGALVTKDGRVVGKGANRVTADLDPTAHAEVNAIRAACRALGSFGLQGAVLYTSCEPCPMCLAAAHWARVERIVFAADRFDAAAADFDDAVLYDELTLPLDQRRTPIHHLALATRLRPFDTWRAQAARTHY
ncbi:MAG: nucleoside deaminase [Pseudomonadota bacterium]